MLKPFQEGILRIFSALPDAKEFYLTGGTALAAFYLGHRLSEDFDLFTGVGELVRPLGIRFGEALERQRFQVRITRNFESFYESTVSKDQDSLKIQLAQDSPYRLATALMSDYGVAVDDLEDVAANKLLALSGRWTPRDLFDVFMLIETKQSDLKTMIDNAAKKDPGFDLYYLALAF